MTVDSVKLGRCWRRDSSTLNAPKLSVDQVTDILQRHGVPLTDRRNFLQLIDGSIDDRLFGVKMAFRRSYKAAVAEIMRAMAKR
jgi:hypothetical protein